MSTPPSPSSQVQAPLSVRSQASSLVRLALPIILTRAGWMFLGFADVVMVGRFGTNDLAHMSLATNLMSVAYITMMGLLLGTQIVAANLYGAERHAELGAVWRRSLPYAFWLGVVLLLLSRCAETVLLWTGQQAEIAREAGRLVEIYGYGMPLGGLIYITSQYFLEGIRRPMPGLIMMLVANAANVALNWLLIYGHAGLEPLGAAGSAWGTTIIRIVLALAIVAYIVLMPQAQAWGVRQRYTGGWHRWSEQRRLGYAAGVSFGIEHLAFVMLFVFAGLLGATDLAAVTIVFNTFAVFFMVGAGIASATAVQVGVAWGRRNPREMRIAGWTGWSLMMAVLCVPAASMVLFPNVYAGLYTNDATVIALSLPLFVLAGISLLLDTTQTVWANALRGQHDKWFASASHFVSYLLIMAPLAWYLAIPRGHRGEGLFEALIVASVVSVSLLTSRFVWLSRERDH